MVVFGYLLCAVVSWHDCELSSLRVVLSLCSEVVWLVVNVGDEWTQLHMFRRWYEEMD